MVFQMDKGRSPSGCPRIELEIENQRVSFKGFVHSKPKNAFSFPMDHLHFMDSFLRTNPEVFTYSRSRIFRLEGVKIENSIDRELYDVFFVNHFLLMKTIKISPLALPAFL